MGEQIYNSDEFVKILYDQPLSYLPVFIGQLKEYDKYCFVVASKKNHIIYNNFLFLFFFYFLFFVL